MNCDDVWPKLRDYQRGVLSSRLQDEIRVHLQACDRCEHEASAEELLTDVLEYRLPRHSAPVTLRRHLGEQWPAIPRQKRSWWARWGQTFVPALASTAALLIAIPTYYEHHWRSASVPTRIVAEAVTDHLRLLASQHPLDVDSSNMHQASPWYEGRLDFAPVVTFRGDAEFPLVGGAVGYFLDQKAAVFVFHRRRHTISLFVFPARGISWPTHGFDSVGAMSLYRATDRGFNVVLWRYSDQGCALVSDVDPAALTQLAVRLAAAS
jgi:anti-sigma factor RsiW